MKYLLVLLALIAGCAQEEKSRHIMVIVKGPKGTLGWSVDVDVKASSREYRRVEVKVDDSDLKYLNEGNREGTPSRKVD